MKSLYSFIITPYKERYNNEINVGDKKLILNTNIEIHSSVDKRAVVVSTPAAFNTKIKVGDIVYVHQIYLYKSDKKLNCNLDYCFASPVKEDDVLSLEKEKLMLGVMKYCSSSLKDLGINPGDLITFSPDSEFEFIVENELLYCMKSKDIALKHEDKGNEKKYNPSWAKSS